MALFSSSAGSNITVTPSGGTNPLVQNVSMSTANTEYSFTLPAGTRQFELRSRQAGKLQLSYTAGTTATLYRTIWPGTAYSESNLLLTAALDIYVQSTKGSDILEVVSWA